MNEEFGMGTNYYVRVRIYYFGKVDALVTNATGRIVRGSWFAPFRTSLGIVPEAK